MDFSNYKFTSHALGNIVSKSGGLTDNVKKYLKELFISEIYKVRKQIDSKYLEKGLFEEESGITLLNETLYKGRLILKNKERKFNDYIQGECDCVVDDYVYDIKNAWDLFTFGKSELTHNYYWQLVGYMWLWKKPKARLFYCLNNTPEHILLKEERSIFYNGNYISFDNEDYVNACNAMRLKHKHDNKELWERFKVTDIGYNPSDVATLITSIGSARNYLNELSIKHTQNIINNMTLMGIN